MKQFGTILKFELKNYFTNKAFVGITLFLVAAIILVTFFPRITSLFKEEEPPPQESGRVIYVAARQSDAETYRAAFASAFPDDTVKTAEADPNTLRSAVESGEAYCSFLIESPVKYVYYVTNLSLFDENSAVADQILQNVYRVNALAEYGVSPEKTGQIFSVTVEHETESIGQDQTQNFFYTYIMVFALYMVILMYGQMVAMSVATEKSSRAMELLITSAKPVNMMFGKVLAACLAGLIQLTVIFGSALFFFNLNRAYWSENPILAAFFDIPLPLLLYMLVFFLLGFLIYAFLYGAVGSTVSKLEDVNTAVMPVTILFIVGFMVSVFSMTSGGGVESLPIKICSFIPFWSPMSMFTRIAMGSVAGWEIALSIGILAATVILIGVIAAKIYRVGVLLYGNKPSVSGILKALRKS